jgi:hypothetical protein
MFSVRNRIYEAVKDITNVYYEEADGKAQLPLAVFNFPYVSARDIDDTDNAVLQFEVFASVEEAEQAEVIARQIDLVLGGLKCVEEDAKFYIRRMDPYWLIIPQGKSGVKGIRLKYAVILFNHFSD